MDRPEGRKRPWLQFSLRTLFILTIGIALGFAPLKVWELTAPAKQQVTLETKMLEVPAGLVAELGLTLSRDGLTGAPRIVDLAELERQIATLKTRGAKVVAEPTLCTLSGRPSKFTMGGEVPVPVTDENGLSTVEYREVGIGVEFVPTILRNGRINLALDTTDSRVKPQLSTSLSGFTVPQQIDSVSSHTEFELADGETVLLGGLAIDPDRTSQRGVLVVAATVRKMRR
ncbi:MAG TPA: hypothetical protein VFV87_21050 [Pirellulaceae bacterium]|nr:hypothetical protein [Pirellulaceae bacterium]